MASDKVETAEEFTDALVELIHAETWEQISARIAARDSAIRAEATRGERERIVARLRIAARDTEIVSRSIAFAHAANLIASESDDGAVKRAK